MNHIKRTWIWIRRIGHCRGFGIQSPTDYQFVRYVINEHWPYYEYEKLGKGNDWLTHKLGKLYFRVANWRQPGTIVDMVGARDYLQAGCKKAAVVAQAETIELACVPIGKSDYQQLFGLCTDQSVVIFQDIWQQMALWRRIEHDEHVAISYDLYYCGIVIFDSKRTKQSYVINF